MKTFLQISTAAAIIISVVLYFAGWTHSPQINTKTKNKSDQSQSNTNKFNSRNFKTEKILAEAYWRRYPGIKRHQLWGEFGLMGVNGPRAHYEQHGHNEGRIFAPIVLPNDLTKEKILAEAYWSRYPRIRHSITWGEKSNLGILGPRDHYLNHGKKLGTVWGELTPEKHLP